MVVPKRRQTEEKKGIDSIDDDSETYKFSGNSIQVCLAEIGQLKELVSEVY